MQDKRLTEEQKQGLEQMCNGWLAVNEYAGTNNPISNLIASGEYTFKEMIRLAVAAKSVYHEERSADVSALEQEQFSKLHRQEAWDTWRFLYELAFHAAE